MGGQRRKHTDKCDFAEEQPGKSYSVVMNGNGPHHSDGEDLSGAAANARAHCPVRWNKPPRHADVDQPCADRCSKHVSLPFRTLQETLNWAKKCFGHT